MTHRKERGGQRVNTDNVAYFPPSYWQKAERPQQRDGASTNTGPTVSRRVTGSWQIDRDAEGRVTQVWLTKKTGSAEGLWTFEPSEEDGEAVLIVQRHERDPEGVGFSYPLERWVFPDSLRDEVGEQARAHRAIRRGAGKDGRDDMITDMVTALAELIGWRSAEAVERRLVER